MVTYVLPLYFFLTKNFSPMDLIDFTEEKRKFGKNIVKLRKRIKSSEYKNRSISQQELSDKSDYFSKKNLGDIERGDGNPTFETILALANILEVHPKELFDF